MHRDFSGTRSDGFAILCPTPISLSLWIDGISTSSPRGLLRHSTLGNFQASLVFFTYIDDKTDNERRFLDDTAVIEVWNAVDKVVQIRGRVV